MQSLLTRTRFVFKIQHNLYIESYFDLLFVEQTRRNKIQNGKENIKYMYNIPLDICIEYLRFTEKEDQS